MVSYKVRQAKKVGKRGERLALLYDGASLLGYVLVERLQNEPAILDVLKAFKPGDQDSDPAVEDDDA